jgi:tetratricopeptide (TPR) repeat protein
MEPRPDAADACRRGDELLDRDDPEGALSAYEEAVRLDPGFGRAYAALAGARRRSGDLDGALDALDRAERAEVVVPGGREFRAGLHAERGLERLRAARPELALADLNAADRLRPGDADTLARRAQALLALGRPDDALADVEAALERRPGHPEALALRGALRLITSEEADAWTDCEEALEADPGNYLARMARGMARLALGMTEEALEDFDAARAAHPEQPGPYLARWEAHFRADRFDEAEAACDEAMRRFPGMGLAYLLRSLVHDARDDAVAALEDRERATELNPRLSDLVLGALQADEPLRLTPALARAMREEMLRRPPAEEG